MTLYGVSKLNQKVEKHAPFEQKIARYQLLCKPVYTVNMSVLLKNDVNQRLSFYYEETSANFQLKQRQKSFATFSILALAYSLALSSRLGQFCCFQVSGAIISSSASGGANVSTPLRFFPSILALKISTTYWGGGPLSKHKHKHKHHFHNLHALNIYFMLNKDFVARNSEKMKNWSFLWKPHIGHPH